MVATPHRICPEGRCVLSTAQSERVAGSPRRRVQRITNRMLGMGKIVTVHVQASSFTYLVQSTRANNAPYIAWQRCSPFLASFLLSFAPSSRRLGPRAINCRNAPPDLPGGALCFVDRSK